MLVSEQDEHTSQEEKPTDENDDPSSTHEQYTDPANNASAQPLSEPSDSKSDTDIELHAAIPNPQPSIWVEKIKNRKSPTDQTDQTDLRQIKPGETTENEKTKASTEPITCPEESSSETNHIQVSPSSVDSANSLDSDYFIQTSSGEKHADSSDKIDPNLNVANGSAATFHSAKSDTNNVNTQLDTKCGQHSVGEGDVGGGHKHTNQAIGHVSGQDKKRSPDDNDDRSTDSKKCRFTSLEQNEREDEDISSSSTGTCTSHGETSDGATFSLDADHNQKHTKRKLKRTQYSKSDLRILNAHFAEDNWLSPIKQEELAKQMGYTDVQIKTWFQNKRASIYGTRQPKGKTKDLSASSHPDYDRLDQRLSTFYAPEFSHGNPFLPQFHGAALTSQMHSLVTCNQSGTNGLPIATNRLTDNQILPHLINHVNHSNTDKQVPISLSQISNKIPLHVQTNSKVMPHVTKSPISAITKNQSNGTDISAPVANNKPNGTDISASVANNKTNGVDLSSNASIAHQTSKPNLPRATENRLVCTVDRVRSTYSRIDYSLPENNPFIAAFLNLSDRPHWSSPIFSPLVKPHLTPQYSVPSPVANWLRLA